MENQIIDLKLKIKLLFSEFDKGEHFLAEIKQMGKQLFYDPILSGNNLRSCASCHKPTEYFTDTTLATAFQFDRQLHVSRNAPSLINSVFNHLIMFDGKHISLQGQAKEVILNPIEMNSKEKELVKNSLKDTYEKLVMRCSFGIINAGRNSA